MKANMQMVKSCRTLVFSFAISSSLQPLEYDTFLVDFQGKKRLTLLPDDDGNIGEFTVASIPFKHQR